MEREEFESIYTTYYSRVLCYVQKRISNKGTAEEITEEVFLNIYKHRESFDPERCSIGTWVYVAANNRLKNYYRDKKEYVPIEDIQEPAMAGEYEPENAYILEEQRAALLEALSEMSVKERSLLIKKYYQGKSSEEIALEMQMSSGNVRITTMRALKKLKGIMEKRGEK